MIEQHPEIIRKTFTPERPIPADHNPLMLPLTIVSDKAGNIWYLENHRVLVYVRDHWVLASEPLTAAGSRRGNVGYLSAVGDGSKVYVSDRGMLYEGGCCFSAK